MLSWGRGASGQLGHAEIVSNCLYPKLVDSLTNFNISHVSAGWNHSGFVSGFDLLLFYFVISCLFDFMNSNVFVFS